MRPLLRRALEWAAGHPRYCHGVAQAALNVAVVFGWQLTPDQLAALNVLGAAIIGSGIYEKVAPT